MTETKQSKTDPPVSADVGPTVVSGELSAIEICRDDKVSHLIPIASVIQIVIDDTGLIVEHRSADVHKNQVGRVTDLSQIKMRSAAPEALLNAAKAEVKRRIKVANKSA